VRFTNSGTEANLMALTLARVHTGRPGILVFRGGYHGSVLTFVGGAPSSMTAPLDFVMADYNDLPGTEAILRAEHARIGAVILEPMQGSGGCIPAEPTFLEGLRAITQELGMILIFDEVMTSRHSPGGLQQALGVRPDLTTLGKYLAGGMSIGAFGGSATLMNAFDPSQPGALMHAGTFNNNVLSMAGGVEALGTVFDAETAAAHYAKGEALRHRLNEVCGTAMQFTGRGTMLQPHFRPGQILRAYKPSPAEEALNELFFFDMLEAGIYLARRGMVALSLPVGPAECARFVSAVAEFCSVRGALLRADS